MMLIATMVTYMIMMLMVMVIMMLVCFVMTLMVFIVVMALLVVLITFVVDMLFFMTNNIGCPGHINFGVCTMSMKELNTFFYIFGVNDSLTDGLWDFSFLHHFFGMTLLFFLILALWS